MDTKICAHCKQAKPLTQFGRERNNKDGLKNRCKACRSIDARNRYRADPEKILARVDPEKRREAVYRYANKHPDKIQARAILTRAILQGQLPAAKTLKCVRCGKQASQYHHHKGYDKEHSLDVVPVCRSCHYFIDLKTK